MKKQEAVSGGTPRTGKQENVVSLSKELGRVLDDYNQGEDIGEPLELCVEMAVSLESELTQHRLGDVDRAARQVVEGATEDIMAGGESRVVRVDFGNGTRGGHGACRDRENRKEREDGRGI